MERALYVHIPFCLKKCLYCDFYSITDLTLQDCYIDVLLKEIKEIEDKELKSIFIGGGTPTVLSKYNLERLLKNLSRFDFKEFTVEANPGTLNEEKLLLLKDYGVNRLSIGLQAVQDNLLKRLGRIHNFNDFLNNYEMARKIGFKNINVDLMFNIPEQSIDDWMDTLNKIVDLNPEHISIYSLILEEGTVFYDYYQKGELSISDDEIDRQMYHYAVEFLKSYGYEHYEISNFAKKGFECIHNLTYWNEEEYYGVGASAHSFIDSYRYANASDIKEYITSRYLKREKIYISKEEQMQEFMILGLRKIKGISKKDFKNRFNVDIIEVYGDKISKLLRQGLVFDNGEFISLTSKGLDVANQVFLVFL
ncbi:oxygen-independent coproporphyrinogen-3 oxidase [Caloramator fervidus]|uniref:Heme chaperone HemW n=1 Tax=Caloramator fervidus TaxID=29344 RepID=A0A1H5UHT8_9CLOT|nr:radical SAM family heme chaperone HemW [Caloramator fervidus]SEF74596.1 oxygen-independent coproporphyrinogen-3 oxidase [Caloramator fervidus]